jgi:hypothetical protein
MNNLQGERLKRVWKMHTLEMILCCVDSLGEACILRMVLWSTEDELVLIDPRSN